LDRFGQNINLGVDRSGQMCIVVSMTKMPKFNDNDDSKRKFPYGWDFRFQFGPLEKYKRHRPVFKTKKAKGEYYTDFEKKFFSDRDSFLDFDKDLYTRFKYYEEKLIEMNVTFDELTTHYIDHKPRHTAVTITQAFEEMKANLTKEGFRGLGHFILHLNRFIEFIDDPIRNVDLIEREEVQAWVNKLETDFAHKTVKNHVKHLRMVLNREKKLRRLEHSPAEFISTKKEIGDQEPETMNVENVITLLEWCEINDPSLAGMLALQFFTGLRVSVIAPELAKQREDGQFTLDMINFKDQNIIVPGKLMKKKKRLFIETIMNEKTADGWEGLPPRIWSWLALIDKKDCCKNGINKSRYNERREQACWKSGVKWVHNAPRHSFGTYYSTLKGSNERASQIMAVETNSIFVRNYQGVRSYEEAKKFFTIQPKNNCTTSC